VTRDGDRWSVGPQETTATLLADLHAQGTRSRPLSRPTEFATGASEE